MMSTLNNDEDNTEVSFIEPEPPVMDFPQRVQVDEEADSKPSLHPTEEEEDFNAPTAKSSSSKRKYLLPLLGVAIAVAAVFTVGIATGVSSSKNSANVSAAKMTYMDGEDESGDDDDCEEEEAGFEAVRRRHLQSVLPSNDEFSLSTTSLALDEESDDVADYEGPDFLTTLQLLIKNGTLQEDGDGYIIDIEEGEEVPEGFPDTVAEGDQVAEITPGSEVAPDDWQKYQVSIGKGNSLTDGVSTYGGHVCGGTLIDSHAVLTAAHCFCANGRFKRGLLKWVDFNKYNLEEKLRDSGVTRQFFKKENVIHHPEFKCPIPSDTFWKPDPPPGPWNMAIILLNDSMVGISPVTLSRDPEVPQASSPLQVLGWGYAWRRCSGWFCFKLSPVGIPRTQGLDVVSEDLCSNKLIWGSSIDYENVFCAGRFGLGQGACYHDDGGPAIENGVQTGITSFYSPSCTIKPSVYTRVSAGYDWIAETVCAKSNLSPMCPSEKPSAAPTPSPSVSNAPTSKSGKCAKGAKTKSKKF